MNAPSARALAMIEQFEIGDSYSPAPCWPGGDSGITIGVGYDLGQVSALRVGIDWSALPDGVVTRLMSYAGTSGAAAQRLLAACQDIIVPEVVALQVFNTINIPRACVQTEAAFLNCDLLSGDSFGALLSLVFNRGASMTDPPGDPGRRLEMRQIRDAMAARDFAAVPDFIRAMKRLWPGTGLVGRRDAEADLFAAGLQTNLTT